MTGTIEYELKEIITQIKQDIKRAGWTKARVQEHLILAYFKDGLLKLTDNELLEFMEFCNRLPTKTAIKLPSLELPSLPPIKPTTERTVGIEPAF